MVVKKRETGINVIGALPWGSHVCVFYGTRQDILDTLVPYFKAGLENNELCILIVSDSPGEKEVRAAMKEGIPDFAYYSENGRIEIYPHTLAYFEGGVLNTNKLLKAVPVKSHEACDKGCDGIRIGGVSSWLDKEMWDNFTCYEAEVNKAISQTRTLVLCAFPLDKCGASQFIDVMKNHRFAFIVQEGEWISLRKKTAREMNLQLAPGKFSPLTPLQKRFAVSGLKDFTDEEIIELFLSLCPYRKHRHLLPQLVKTFRNIRGLLSASTEELEQAGLDSQCISYIRLLREIPTKVLEDKIKEQPVYGSPQDIFNYLYYSMRDLKKEVLKVIYLNSRNQIIDVVDLFEGVSDKIAVNPREVVESAIENNTTALVFVHNHPSGDPTPGQADKRLTRDLVFVGNILQIRVLDHIIIGENRYFSFASEGLIEEYELDFLNLRLRGTVEAKRRLRKARLSIKKHIGNLTLN